MKIIGKWMGIVLLALPTLFATNIMAQDSKKPTLEDLLPGGETYRFAENLYGVQWWGDTCIKPGIDSLLAINPKTGKETLLVTIKKINANTHQPARKLRCLRLGSGQDYQPTGLPKRERQQGLPYRKWQCGLHHPE